MATMRIDGLRELRTALTKFAPDIKKQLDKANKEVAKPLISFGKTNIVEIPMSKWLLRGWNDNGRDLKWDTAVARKGIKVKQAGRSRKSPWSSIAQFRNESAIGAIFEAAGRQNKPTTPQGAQFIKNHQRWFFIKENGLSRVIWKATFKDYGANKYQDLVFKNYLDAQKDFEDRLAKF